MSDFLSKEKKQLLAQALHQVKPVREPAFRRRDPTAPAPLSFAQQRLWFLHHLDPTKGHCNTPVAIKLTGDLKVEPFIQTLREVARRHESFRTIFPLRDGEPVQVIARDAELDLSVQDLSSLSPSESERVAEAILREEASRPFDIGREPCVRLRLLRLSDQVHWLVLVAHHMVFDTWSMGVFSREMSAIYEAFSAGRQSSLPEPEIQYADFACWERQAEEEGKLAKQLSYWKTKLEGAPDLLPLPFDRPRRPFRGARGNAESFSFGKQVSEAVQALSQRERSSAFMILLSTLSVLIHRYGGGRDIVISSAVGNRKLPGTDGLIGCFMNTLLFRTQLSGNPSFRELLRKAREDGLEAHENSDVPFEQVVSALNPKRNPNYSPYSQVMLIVQNAEFPVLGESRVRIERLPVDERFVSQQDLTFHVRPLEGRLVGRIEYNGDLFDQSTIQRLIADFERLLISAVTNPDLRLSQLTVQTPIEAEGRTSTAGEPPIADWEFLHRTIEWQAERTPDSLAVTGEGTQLTYSELNQRANQLAWHLHAAGVGPEHRVAICAGRSPAVLVGLLGTLKAGAGCLPLDPATPRAHLRAIWREAAPMALVTESPIAQALDLRAPNTVCLDGELLGFAEGFDRNPDLPLDPENVAFVLYTSATTAGSRPVLVTHRTLAAVVGSLASTVCKVDDDLPPVQASISPERLPFELLAPLTAGGAAALLLKEATTDAERLRNDIEEAGATVMYAPPLTWRRLLDTGWAAPCGFQALCGGETLPDELAEDLIARGATVWSLYGSAETALWSTVKRLEPGAPVTIGAPVANTSAGVLDEHFQPVPTGVPGELALTGANVARGYLNRPDLTAERFVPDPLATQSGARLYRTGDIVRRTPGGDIGFLYRADNRAALRGFTVKVGEVEAALCGHPSVSQAVVVARGSASDQRNLIAYVVPRRKPASHVAGTISAAGLAPNSPQTLSQDLSEFLKMQLPDYMQPSTFLVLDALPQSANGKVNRKALPEPETVSVAPVMKTFQAPVSGTEKEVAAIWRKVLQLDQVSVNADFFDLGGDSLKAQRMLAHIERDMSVDIPVRVAFANPTIELLALHIDHTRRVGMTEEEEFKSIIDNLSDEEVHALLANVELAAHVGG